MGKENNAAQSALAGSGSSGESSSDSDSNSDADREVEHDQLPSDSLSSDAHSDSSSSDCEQTSASSALEQRRRENAQQGKEIQREIERDKAARTPPPSTNKQPRLPFTSASTSRTHHAHTSSVVPTEDDRVNDHKCMHKWLREEYKALIGPLVAPKKPVAIHPEPYPTEAQNDKYDAEKAVYDKRKELGPFSKLEHDNNNKPFRAPVTSAKNKVSCCAKERDGKGKRGR